MSRFEGGGGGQSNALLPLVGSEKHAINLRGVLRCSFRLICLVRRDVVAVRTLIDSFCDVHVAM